MHANIQQQKHGLCKYLVRYYRRPRNAVEVVLVNASTGASLRNPRSISNCIYCIPHRAFVNSVRSLMMRNFINACAGTLYSGRSCATPRCSRSTGDLKKLSPMPFICAYESTPVYLRPFIRAHSSASIHLRPFICVRSSAPIHLRPFIRAHSLAPIHLRNYRRTSLRSMCLRSKTHFNTAAGVVLHLCARNTTSPHPAHSLTGAHQTSMQRLPALSLYVVAPVKSNPVWCHPVPACCFSRAP